MPVTIRPAQTFDVGFAAPLIQQTIGAIGHILTGTATDQDAAHVIAEFFVLRGNRLSFTNTLLAEQDGLPAGLALLYPGEFAAALDDPFRDWRRTRGLPPTLFSEGLPGELYLDTLAVRADLRGQGLGSRLLEACTAKAQAMQLPLGLLVEENNPARALYLRHGFLDTGRADLAGHLYLRMRRPLTMP